MNRGGTAPTYEFAFDGLGSTEYYEINSGETFVYYNPSANTTGATPHTLIFNAYKQQTDYWNCYFGSARTITASNFSGKGFFRNVIVMGGEADSYCYNQTTGQIYYAGINTPYYGKQNIND